MRRFFRNRSWIVSAGSAAAGAYGIPYPIECLLEDRLAERLVADVDWDTELRVLLDREGLPPSGPEIQSSE